MADISGDMKSICEGIAAAYESRNNSVKGLKGDARAIRKNAVKFVNDCRVVHEKMAAGLRRELKETHKRLQERVNSLREDFKTREEEVLSDLRAASELWNKMGETLRAKKRRART